VLRLFSTTWLLAVWLLASCSTLSAQFKEPVDAKGPKIDRPLVQKLKVGVTVLAVGGPCAGIVATLPMPMEWPEQQVKIVEEDISPTVKNVAQRLANRSVKQLIVDIPQLAAGQEAKAVLTLEITRSTLLPPDNTSIYSIPKKLEKNMLIYLGPSPMIESRHPKIIALAKQLAEGKENAWQQVEGIYDYVREHVKYQNGDLKGAIKALQDKTGDCEELTSLFIAICRASKIPARTVWVPEHCYPEFYLVDDDGKGHWFPCQAAGTRAFGGIPEQRPILQKGDNFKDPERPRERQRYMSEFLKGSGIKGGGQPKVKFIRDVVGA